MVSTEGEFGTVSVGNGEKLIARLAAGVRIGVAVKVALRPDNVLMVPPSIVSADGPNRFKATVETQHYQGTQTVYNLALLGARIEAMEVGSSARFDAGTTITVTLPPEICWAYPG